MPTFWGQITLVPRLIAGSIKKNIKISINIKISYHE